MPEEATALVRRLAPEVPARVVGDAGRLRQILLNLIDNAVKYAGNARVALRTASTFVEITVADDGPGIPEEKLMQALEDALLAAARQQRLAEFKQFGRVLAGDRRLAPAQQRSATF